MLKTCLKLYGTALFWGGTFVAGRLLGVEVAPVITAFWRFAVASLLLLAVIRFKEGGLPRLSGRQVLAVTALGATGIFAYNLCFFAGLTHIGAGRAALIIALNPVAIGIGSALVLREGMTRLRLLGTFISLSGAVLVISRGRLAGLLAGDIGKGELLLFGCVLSWTLYSLIGRRSMRGLTPLAAVTWSSLSGTLFLALVALPRGALNEAFVIGAGSWLAIGYLGLFGTVIGFLWYFQGIQAIGPARAAIFINFVPVNAVLMATLILDEPLSLALITGGVLVLAGAWMAMVPSKDLPAIKVTVDEPGN